MSSLEAVRSVAAQLEEAWNAGNGASFGAVFAEDADFVTIRGELHQGREGNRAWPPEHLRFELRG